MLIAVTGATGQLGRLVVQKLKAKVPAGGIVALARIRCAPIPHGARVFQIDFDFIDHRVVLTTSDGAVRSASSPDDMLHN